MTSMAFQSLAKPIVFLLLLPFLFSVWPHKNLLFSQKCFVGPLDSSFPSEIENDFYGIYQQTQLAFSNDLLNKCKLHHPSTLLRDRANIRYGPELDCEDRFATIFNERTKVWCFLDRESQTTFCKDTVVSKKESSTNFLLSSGTYTSSKSPNEKLSVTCTQPSRSLDRDIRRNQGQEFYPSTTLLLLVNIGLAFIYWDKRVDPYIVCKQYNKIVNDMELWRSFTGALAHFEPLHLGFNMMSLQALGTALEPRYGSVPFLQYNICMIPLTTIVMLLLIKLRIRYTGNNQYSETSSVGFSGVLFAWMVVSSLESYQVCPIPFSSEMCFNTHEFSVGFMKLKFNWGPFVQLLFAQVIMPRVSFIGHLAGIICGFIFHWRILATSIFWSPQVLIPLLMILHWRFVRSINFFIIYSDVDDPSLEVDQIHSNSKGNEIILRHRRLLLTLATMIGVSIISSTQFGVVNSMTMSQILCCFIFLFAIQQHRKRNQSGFSNANEILLWRGTIIALVIILICDALVVPIWLCFQIGIYSNSFMRLDIWIDPLIMVMRWSVNFIALVQASKIIVDMGQSYEQEPKIFSKVFGKIVDWCSNVKHSSSLQAYAPFGGSGNVLGSSATSSNARTRIIADL